MTKNITVANEKGEEWSIDKDILDNECSSATQYSKEEKVNQTQLIDILMDAKTSVFTATFLKQPNPATIAEQLSTLWRNPSTKAGGIRSKEEFDARVKELSKSIANGEERTLTGRIVKMVESRGRAMVLDLNLPKNNNIRQVDLRTISELIINGVKYTC